MKPSTRSTTPNAMKLRMRWSVSSFQTSKTTTRPSAQQGMPLSRCDARPACVPQLPAGPLFEALRVCLRNDAEPPTKEYSLQTIQSAEFARRKRGFGCIWKRPRPTRPTKRSSRREEAHSKAELSQSLVTSAATGHGVFPCAEDGERVE